MSKLDPFVGFVFEPYEIESFLGKGRYGIVYKALNTRTNTYHAVKIYTNSVLKDDPDFKGYIENQISHMKSKFHPNITNLEYHETIPEKGIFLVMEYCNGGTLKSLIKNQNKIKEELALEILRQLVNGFKYLYGMGLMHRDFKSANVLVNKDSAGKIRYKITDFDFIRFNKGNTFLGSILYMAPEVLQNGDENLPENFSYNEKIDIWSLGIVFYEMLYGCFPFNGKNWLAQHEEILRMDGKLIFDGEFSEDCKDFLRKTLVANPEERIGWKEIFKHPAIQKLKKKETETDQNGGYYLDASQISQINQLKKDSKDSPAPKNLNCGIWWNCRIF